jgi:hypothetical protein
MEFRSGNLQLAEAKLPLWVSEVERRLEEVIMEQK